MKNVPSLPDFRRGARLLRWLPAAVLIIFGLGLITTCYTTVPTDSVGVLLRFGRYVDTLPPGLRFKFPFGIDSVTLVPTQRQLKLEMGWDSRRRGAPEGTNPNQYPDAPAEAEASMLTGDLNMASVEWVIQYRINDPKAFLFNVFEPEWTLRDAGEAVMREVVGDRTIDEVLTIGRQDIEAQTLQGMQALSEKYRLGIRVMQVQLQNVRPPDRVQASFNEVNQAQQEKQQAINVANGEYNKVVPKAKGDAERQLSEAQGYATKRVNEARGDADRFNALLAEYLKAPEVTRQRLYLETMRDVMPLLERKILLDDKARQVLPLLELGLPAQPSAR